MDTDVRDLGGRLARLVVAVLVGVVGAYLVAAVLPQTSMRGWGAGALGLANPVLIGAGACGIALGVYVALGVRLRQPPMNLPPARLPAARVTRRSARPRP